MTRSANGKKQAITEKVEGSEFEYSGPSIVQELVELAVVALNVDFS